MTINPSGWRPAAPSEAGVEGGETFTGNRALMLEEPLIFEIGDCETTGVDFETPRAGATRLGNLARTAPIELPGLSEPSGPPLHPPQPPELRDRPWPVPARQLHYEA